MENCSVPSGDFLSSLSSFRARRKRLSLAEVSNSSAWKEDIQCGSDETQKGLATDALPSHGKKRLMMHRRPLVPICEENILPEARPREDVVGSQSDKKERSSEAVSRFRKTMQRRSCVPSLNNTEALPLHTTDGSSSYSRTETASRGISPLASSYVANQEGSRLRNLQESFSESLGIARRRRSMQLLQGEGSLTKAGEEENKEYNQQASVSKALGMARRRRSMQLLQGEGSLTKTEESTKEYEQSSAAQEQVTSYSVSESIISILQKRMLKKNTSDLPEARPREDVVDSQSDKKERSSEAVSDFRTMQRRSCVPSLNNTEALPLQTTDDSSSYSRTETASRGISPLASSSVANQEGSRLRNPQESFSESLGIARRRRSMQLLQGEGSLTKTGEEENKQYNQQVPQLSPTSKHLNIGSESHFARRRRSALLLQREGSNAKAGEGDSSINCHQSTDKRQEEASLEDEGRTNSASSAFITLSSSKKEGEGVVSGNKDEGGRQLRGAERSWANVRRRRSFHNHRRHGAEASQTPIEDHMATHPQHSSSLSRCVSGNSAGSGKPDSLTPLENQRVSIEKTHLQPTATAGQDQDQSQECRRMLQFESEGVNQKLDSPLVMMVQTPIISRASVLQNPVAEVQMKEVNAPVIKKSLLFQHSLKRPLLRKKMSLQVPAKSKSTSEASHNKGQTLQASESEGLLGVTMSGHTEASRENELGHATMDVNKLATKHNSEEEVHSISSSNENLRKRAQLLSSEQSRPKIKLLRRRSVAVLGLRTPLRRKSGTHEAKSAAKMTRPSTASKIPQLRGTERCAKPRKDIVNDENKWQKRTNEADKDTEKNMFTKPAALTDKASSRDTTRDEDAALLKDLQSLLKEQEEIVLKAQVLQQKIEARHLGIEEWSLMESFITSVSPLKRLNALISKRIEGAASATQSCQASGDDTQGQDVSVFEEDCTQELDDSSMILLDASLEAANFTDNPTRWTRTMNKRLVRTSPDREKFMDPGQGNTSPFTSLVGDCERPSLAPMTPHSRRHVSQIKESLKKQLEQLYD